MSQVSFSPSAFFSCPAASDVDSGTSQVDSCLDMLNRWDMWVWDPIIYQIPVLATSLDHLHLAATNVLPWKNLN